MIEDEDEPWVAAQGRIALWILVGATIGGGAFGALVWMASAELIRLLAEWLL